MLPMMMMMQSGVAILETSPKSRLGDVVKDPKNRSRDSQFVSESRPSKPWGALQGDDAAATLGNLTKNNWQSVAFAKWSSNQIDLR